MRPLQVVALFVLLPLVVATDSPQAANSSRTDSSGGPESNKTRVAETLDTAPTVTSVHQIWTSSSSGSLEELSPEMISKMRNDVPFLAAYALRPRLVGASQQVTGNNMISNEDDVLRNRANQLQTSASSPQTARQQQKPNVGKLGEFSEFNVETSSISKSEHQHKRRTTLKRQPEEFRRKILADASRLVKQKRNQKTRPQGEKKRKVSRSKGKSAKRSTRSKSTRSRFSKRNGKRARYFLEEEGKKSMEASNDTATNMLAGNENDGDDDNAGDDLGRAEKDASGLKGGKAGRDRKPFYAKGTSKSEALPTQPANAIDERTATTDKMPSDKPSGAAAAEDRDEFEEAPIDDEPTEPRRVGDGDVDEEQGDTVLVEPKSDGVDDDPEVLADEADETPAEEGETQPSVREGPQIEKSGGAAEGDARGNRVDRERPNPVDGGSSGGGSTAAGGGVGTTLGGGGGNKVGAGGDSDTDESDGDVDGRRPKSSVEFADDADAVDDERRGGGRKGARPNEDDDDHEFRDDDGRRSSTGGQDDVHFGSRRPSGSDSAPAGQGGDKDDGAGKGRGGGSRSEAGRPGRDDDDEDSDAETERRRAGDKSESPSSDKPGDVGRKSNRSDECADDGSYKAHDEKFHDAHHQTSDWLRGSIPGEPGEDYPTLSRVNRSIDFRCSEHKHAGFYADVESRCQIFHICQPDGRQDSFLCPNGTIFSQKTLVCVWWNGFDCEEAPKLYHLNALLYKSASSKDSPQAAALPSLGNAAALDGGQDDDASTQLRPADGSRQTIRPRGMTVSLVGGKNANGLGAETEKDYAADEESSLDGLVRAMRRRSGGEMSAIDGNSSLAPDEEATMQRKSTGGVAANLSAGSARSRLRRAKAIPRRRRRRASGRQAPPRLKSRRVTKSSRRYRLRHQIKPKRRA